MTSAVLKSDPGFLPPGQVEARCGREAESIHEITPGYNLMRIIS